MQWVSFYDFAAIEEYQNNFEKETVEPGSQIPSVLPLPTEQPDSGQSAAESLSQPQDSGSRLPHRRPTDRRNHRRRSRCRPMNGHSAWQI